MSGVPDARQQFGPGPFPALTLGFLLWIAAALLACGGSDRRPDVLLITVDTLRADHLGSYGYRLDTSPNIDALAARGARFEGCTV